MISKNCNLFGTAILTIFIGVILAQNSQSAPSTRFKCQGRPAGYYADIDTGCQVYHMCDGLGRQFSYTCPNTTLFQQRMLVCDHWYMVNCSRAQSDYDANLLIGQRDKPFVSDAEMALRTPRPDILSVPPNDHYYDGLKEAESKFPVHPGNSIVGVADTITGSGNNGLDSAKQTYRPPTSWSTGIGSASNNNTSGQPDRLHHQDTEASSNGDNLAGAASQDPSPTFRPTPTVIETDQNSSNTFAPPNKELIPPLAPQTTTQTPEDSDEYQLDVRMRKNRDPVIKFINRFDPNSPDPNETSMTTSEIININRQLPTSHDISTEEERTPRRHKNAENNFNTLNSDTDKEVTRNTRFETVNLKPTLPSFVNTDNFESDQNSVKAPERVLLPPRTNYSEQPLTTMGPPVYYEWKWAVPAFDLEPPKDSNTTYNSSRISQNSPQKSPFSDVTRPTPKTVDVTPPNTEYNTSSYFIPDYVFPLDKSHPGYESDDAETSFQVKVARPGRASFGENPDCPHCHPAYLNPGTCEPCIVKR